MLLLINTISNLICCLIHQVKSSHFLRIGSIILLSVLYYYSLISITICCLIALIIYLFRLKYIKYDNILPYYKSISILSDSFLDGNINSINEDISIKLIAEESHVGIASVSRFIKSLGLTSFSELRQLLLTNNQTATFYLSETSVSALEKTNVSAVHETVQSISIDSIDELCKEMGKEGIVLLKNGTLIDYASKT